MKRYIIRRKRNLGTKHEHWVYLKSIEINANRTVAEEVPLCLIIEGIRSFETYHEAISLVSKHLTSEWEVASCYSVLMEVVKELNEAKA